ncbi:unnamed protein product [Timema podura]|uniref:Uncharacterized protein n=1 Tax=Timema podura TaxID=61482 RepID=A0ABN7PFJ0_TIMPD|nr:unnamed protein product [Timema podura]
MLIKPQPSPYHCTSWGELKTSYPEIKRSLCVPPLPLTRLTGHERRVGGFDLIWDDGPVWALCPGFTSCDLVLPTDPFPQRLNIFLGCLNNREQQLIELEKFRKQSDHLEATQHICQ